MAMLNLLRLAPSTGAGPLAHVYANNDGLLSTLSGKQVGGPLSASDWVLLRHICGANVAQITSVNGAADSTWRPLLSIPVPGGSLGPNGSISMEQMIQYANNADIKQFRWVLGGQVVSPEIQQTTTTLFTAQIQVDNAGSETAQQFVQSIVINAQTTQPIVAAAVDTRIDQTLELQARWTAATSAIQSITLRRATVKIRRG